MNRKNIKKEQTNNTNNNHYLSTKSINNTNQYTNPIGFDSLTLKAEIINNDIVELPFKKKTRKLNLKTMNNILHIKFNPNKFHNDNQISPTTLEQYYINFMNVENIVKEYFPDFDIFNSEIHKMELHKTIKLDHSSPNYIQMLVNLQPKLPKNIPFHFYNTDSGSYYSSTQDIKTIIYDKNSEYVAKSLGKNKSINFKSMDDNVIRAEISYRSSKKIKEIYELTKLDDFLNNWDYVKAKYEDHFLSLLNLDPAINENDDSIIDFDYIQKSINNTSICKTLEHFGHIYLTENNLTSLNSIKLKSPSEKTRFKKLLNEHQLENSKVNKIPLSYLYLELKKKITS